MASQKSEQFSISNFCWDEWITALSFPAEFIGFLNFVCLSLFSFCSRIKILNKTWSKWLPIDEQRNY